MTIYFSVNQGIYGHVAGSHAGRGAVYFLVMCNRGIYSNIFII
jgi:hypothetical protein